MDLKLKDKVAIVTGTGSQIGFGHAIALTLAKEGCHVAGFDLDGEGAEKTAAEIKKLGRKATATKVDISNKEAVNAAVAAVVKEFGTIDILVNDAGRSVPWSESIGYEVEDYMKTMSVNLFGSFNMVKAVAPVMIEKKHGRIVNFSGGQNYPMIPPTALPRARSIPGPWPWPKNCCPKVFMSTYSCLLPPKPIWAPPTYPKVSGIRSKSTSR
jgi:NAD(P)-dependent dehydrogenase (short-subunit alcohol dehydrogenase family)